MSTFLPGARNAAPVPRWLLPSPMLLALWMPFVGETMFNCMLPISWGNNTRKECNVYTLRVYLSHGARRARPHLLRLLELGAEVGRRLCGFGVGGSHLRNTRDDSFKQSPPNGMGKRQNQRPAAPEIGRRRSMLPRRRSVSCRVMCFKEAGENRLVKINLALLSFLRAKQQRKN